MGKIKRGPYKFKRQATHELALYYLSKEEERRKLVEELRSLDFGFSRVAIRLEIQKSLWYKAYSIAYTRHIANVATSMMIDEVLRS
jgi:hypothetical protein